MAFGRGPTVRLREHATRKLGLLRGPTWPSAIESAAAEAKTVAAAQTSEAKATETTQALPEQTGQAVSAAGRWHAGWRRNGCGHAVGRGHDRCRYDGCG